MLGAEIALMSEDTLKKKSFFIVIFQGTGEESKENCLKRQSSHV